MLKTEDPKGPCYSGNLLINKKKTCFIHYPSHSICLPGICLPKNINDIFNTPTVTGTYVSRCVQEMDAMDMSLNKHQHLMSDSLNEGDESTVSSLSDISTNSKRSKWVGKHNRANCLQCCRLKSYRFNARTESDINMHRRRSNQSSSNQFSDISFDSPESVFSEESMIDRITANILRHVQRMANPVWTKQSKIALLELRQKHPATFQDICLYSEVCKALSKNTYRLNARRFLQELFLDLDFDQFYAEPTEIMVRKERERELMNFSATSASCDNNSRDRLIVDDKDIISNSRSSTSSLSVSIGGQDCTDSAGGGSTAVVGGPSVNSSAAMSSAYYSNLLKSHMKSPPLASVYETSIENLSESLGKNNKQPNLSASMGGGTKILTIATINTNIGGNNENTRFDRPRFNTLDLSCTKNKFPVKHRDSKEYVSPTTPISAAALLNSFQTEFRRSSSMSLSNAPTTGSLFCEKRLESSKSEATLLKRNKSMSSSTSSTTTEPKQ